jgi:hypothetical protein
MIALLSCEQDTLIDSYVSRDSLAGSTLPASRVHTLPTGAVMVHTWLLVGDGIRPKPYGGGQTVFNPKGKVCPCQGGNDLPLTVGLARLYAADESFSTFEPMEYPTFRRRRLGESCPPDGASLESTRGDRVQGPALATWPPLGSKTTPALAGGPLEDSGRRNSRLPG